MPARGVVGGRVDGLLARTEPARKDGQDATGPAPFVVAAADGHLIKGFAWRHMGGNPPDRPVVIINAATSVRCRYYFRFAAFLFGEGMDLITYDYRGIGESRPATLRGFDAGWIDWGTSTSRLCFVTPRGCIRVSPSRLSATASAEC